MNKRNGWLLASGIISIIDAVLMGLTAFGCLILTLTYKSIAADIPPDATIEGTVPPDGFVYGLFAFLIVLFLLFMTAAIVCSVIYLKNSSKSFDELHSNSGAIITAIVLSFLCCGWLVGLFAVLGYTIRPVESVQTAPNTAHVEPNSAYTESPKPNHAASEEAIKKLEDLKRLYDNGLLTEEEFKEKKKEYLDKI